MFVRFRDASANEFAVAAFTPSADLPPPCPALTRHLDQLRNGACPFYIINYVINSYEEIFVYMYTYIRKKKNVKISPRYRRPNIHISRNASRLSARTLWAKLRHENDISRYDGLFPAVFFAILITRRDAECNIMWNALYCYPSPHGRQHFLHPTLKRLC